MLQVTAPNTFIAWFLSCQIVSSEWFKHNSSGAGRPGPWLRSTFCFRPLIKEKLSQGVTLVVDRYAFSGVAFTSAKENFSLHWCKQPDVGLPKPDLVVFLQLRLAEAAKRGEFGHERYENGSFQKRALQSFGQLMGDKTLNWRVVDASRSIEDVHKEIHELCEDTIQAAMHRPLEELWT